ncbi:MAG: hypothetical protein HY438_01430 [DPANN group archaeon]|nr:hypothetical protein [DPANN group archaeon]
MELEDILRQRLRDVGEELGDSELTVDEADVLDTAALADHIVEAKIVRKAMRGIFETERDAKRTIVALQHFNYYSLTKRKAVAMVLDCLMYNARTFTDAANAAQALDVPAVHGTLKKYHTKELDYETEQVYNNIVMSLSYVARGIRDKDTVTRVATLLNSCEPEEIDAATGCFAKVITYVCDADIINYLCEVFENERDRDRDSLLGTMNDFDRFIYNHQNEPEIVRSELERQLAQ